MNPRRSFSKNRFGFALQFSKVKIIFCEDEYFIVKKNSYEFAHEIFPCIKNLCLVISKNFNEIKKDFLQKNHRH